MLFGFCNKWLTVYTYESETVRAAWHLRSKFANLSLHHIVFDCVQIRSKFYDFLHESLRHDFLRSFSFLRVNAIQSCHSRWSKLLEWRRPKQSVAGESRRGGWLRKLTTVTSSFYECVWTFPGSYPLLACIDVLKIVLVLGKSLYIDYVQGVSTIFNYLQSWCGGRGCKICLTLWRSHWYNNFKCHSLLASTKALKNLYLMLSVLSLVGGVPTIKHWLLPIQTVTFNEIMWPWMVCKVTQQF